MSFLPRTLFVGFDTVVVVVAIIDVVVIFDFLASAVCMGSTSKKDESENQDGSKSKKNMMEGGVDITSG